MNVSSSWGFPNIESIPSDLSGQLRNPRGHLSLGRRQGGQKAKEEIGSMVGAQSTPKVGKGEFHKEVLHFANY